MRNTPSLEKVVLVLAAVAVVDCCCSYVVCFLLLWVAVVIAVVGVLVFGVLVDCNDEKIIVVTKLCWLFLL